MLVARHNPWLSDNTNVAATNPDIAALKRTKPGEMIPVTYDSTTVGGPAAYLSLKLLGGTTFDDAAERPSAENGMYPTLTMQEIIDIQKAQAKKYDRTITCTRSRRKTIYTSKQDAHDAGLFVRVYTFRNETKYLAAYYDQDPVQEFPTFYREGVDGVFTGFVNTAWPRASCF